MITILFIAGIYYLLRQMSSDLRETYKNEVNENQ